MDAHVGSDEATMRDPSLVGGNRVASLDVEQKHPSDSHHVKLEEFQEKVLSLRLSPSLPLL